MIGLKKLLILMSIKRLYKFFKFINITSSFLPEMERLFLSSPSYRRNFIDRLIFSEKNNYNKTINKYKKFLTERAKFLQQNQTDMDWINYIEAQISEHALKIYDLRNSQLKIINTQIDQLNKSNEFPFNINLQINDNFLTDNISYDQYINELKSIREFDKKYGGSKIGPHKSDIYATINQSYDASLLSTGQQKTVVLMILLAQCNHLVNFKILNQFYFLMKFVLTLIQIIVRFY